jgi:superfamily II DNA or RNA helicase
MQCGPIRYTAAKPTGAPHDLEVLPRSRFTRIEVPTDAGIQDVFRHLATDQARTEAIAAGVRDAVGQGRKVLVLTERTEHLGAIKATLDGLEPVPFVLHGRMSRGQRAALVADLDALPPDAARVLLSTGKLIGEGFDHPPLDTRVLAMPVSWKAHREVPVVPPHPGRLPSLAQLFANQSLYFTSGNPSDDCLG